MTGIYEQFFTRSIELPLDDDTVVPPPIVLCADDIEGFGPGWSVDKDDPRFLIVDEDANKADAAEEGQDSAGRLGALFIRLAVRTGGPVMGWCRYVSVEHSDRGFAPFHLDPSAPYGERISVRVYADTE
ncbi:MAG: hypothetical protein AB7G47_21270 [Mycolicibacterium sp.]|uniref:hypothetical protein n=1 Tax=Mycolicibacterium sp. TaxID=2320850 RepID=UPI003D11D132